MGLSESPIRPLAAQGLLDAPQGSLSHRLWQSVARDGLAATFGKGLRRLTSPWLEVGSLVLFARDLEEPTPAVSGEGWRVREAGASDLDAVRLGSDPARPLEVLRERFRRGHHCFVAEGADGSVGHTRWVTSEPPPVPEVGRQLLLGPADVYFYDGFTRSDARRRGLDGITRCAIFEAMRERGYRRAVSYVRGDNPRGLRAAGRWQTEIGRVRYLRLGRRRSWLLGRGTIGALAFSPPHTGDDELEGARRSRHWRAWFEGWLGEPLERRSTGFSALPEEYFSAVADFVAATLGLSAGSDRVLDVGCASAGVTRLLAGRCHELTGMDFVPGLLVDARRRAARSATGEPARFVNGDARLLPFASGRLDKVCCVGVVHTLPTAEDGFRVVRELIRVCAPGGRILVGALPDRERRWRARAECWRRGTARERLRVVGALLLPRPLKRLLRRWAGLPPEPRLVGLEYDLAAWKERIEALGAECEILPFPQDFWSRDFRSTRSNLLISKPG